MFIPSEQEGRPALPRWEEMALSWVLTNKFGSVQA